MKSDLFTGDPMNHSQKWVGLALILLAILTGCSSETEVDQTKEFLKNARDETTAITSLKLRFRRQLNVADAQLSNDESPEARETLAVAEATLRSTKPNELDDHTALAAWVSLSELYTRAIDSDEDGKKKHPEQYVPPNAALDKAIAFLHQVQPESVRTYYARSIAKEIRRLRDSAAAVNAMVEAGPWADQIKNEHERRRAYRAFARDILRDNDFRAATAMLKRDPDPVWRIDAAVWLTKSNYVYPRLKDTDEYIASSGLSGSRMSLISRTSDQEDFGIPLDYQSNFEDKPEATTQPEMQQ